MHRRPFAFAFALAALALTACSQPSETETGTGGDGETEKNAASYSFKFTTHPGEETHWCQYTRLPEGDGKEVVVTGYSWAGQNAHHWALYRTTSDLPADVALDQPFDCFEPGAMKYAENASLILAAGGEGEQMFPEGTGFGFKPGEIVVFQAHTLNTTTADVEAKVDVKMETADPASVPDRLGLIQFYDPYIDVPAHTKSKAQMRCNVPQDMTVLFGTTHEHTRGTGVSVFLDTPDGARADKPFLQSTEWEHPTVMKDALHLTAGSHIRTVCDYMGDDRDVVQGQNKNASEMCMFIGYYYPAIPQDEGGAAFENCVQTPIPGGVGDEYGTGIKTCADSLSCIQQCPPGDAPRPGDGRIDVGACWQRCLVDSCAAAAAPLNNLGFCVQNHCAEACAGGDCASCVVSNCVNEYSACQNTACGL